MINVLTYNVVLVLRVVILVKFIMEMKMSQFNSPARYSQYAVRTGLLL